MSFWGSFSGSDQRRDTRNAKNASDKALDSGFNNATTLYNQASDIQQPYVDQGREGFAQYNNAIGLGSDADRAQIQSRYFDDPAQAAVLGQQSNALLRNLNARGQSGGGMAALAGQRVGIEGYNNWLNRLQGVGAQGQQAATTQSNIKLGQGDLNFGYGATKAGSEINYGNAQAANRGILGNNLLNVAATAAKAFAASDIRLKRDIKRIDTLPSGLPVYRFKYLDHDAEYVGVMAQEAMQIFPAAVAVMDNGYFAVDYAQIR